MLLTLLALWWLNCVQPNEPFGGSAAMPADGFRAPFGMGGQALLPALPSSPPCSREVAVVCPLMLVRLPT